MARRFSEAELRDRLNRIAAAREAHPRQPDPRQEAANAETAALYEEALRTANGRKKNA